MVNTLEQQTQQAINFQKFGLYDKPVSALSLPEDIKIQSEKAQENTGFFRGLKTAFSNLFGINEEEPNTDLGIKPVDKPKDTKNIDTQMSMALPIDPFVPRVETVDKYGMPLNPSKVKEGSSLRPELRPEDFDPDRNKAEAAENFESAIDYIASMGWILGQKTKDAKGQDLTKIVTGLDQRNPDHQKSIMGFFYTAQGGEFNPLEKDGEITAWCAAFVHHVLTNLGADTLEVGKSGNNRIRANSFMDYGTAVDGIENAQEGDIIIWDWPRDAKGKIAETSGKKDGRGDHVAFYAGDRITGQGEADYVNVVGGNQSGTVSLRENNSLYVKRNIIGIRRITKNDITVSLTKDLAKQNPIFKPFIANVTNKKEAGYAQGGLTDMNNQTQMAFALGGEAETVDPISGNDVPPGSLPVEVRDDIDAKLSEGEYVVPADVVRFFGVKYFEDLRMEAKNGLQQMDADGRIGGEPVADEPQMQMAEMGDQDIDALIDAEMNNMNQGGMIGQQNPSNSMYSDPNKVDDVIAKIGEAAAQNPEISRMLGERGIAVPTTGAMQTPEEMKDANTPEISEEPKIAANQGGLMGYAPGGSVSGYDPSAVPTLGLDFDQGFDTDAYFDGLMGDGTTKSTITSQVVLMPDGTEMELYWPADVPLPEGYSFKASMALPTVDGLGARREDIPKGRDSGKSDADVKFDREQDAKNAPAQIDLNKVTSLEDLQLFQMDMERQRGIVSAIPIIGATVVALSDASMRVAVDGFKDSINAMEEGAAKSSLAVKFNRFIKGQDVATGGTLKKLGVNFFGVPKNDPRRPKLDRLRKIKGFGSPYTFDPNEEVNPEQLKKGLTSILEGGAQSLASSLVAPFGIGSDILGSPEEISTTEIGDSTAELAPDAIVSAQNEGESKPDLFGPEYETVTNLNTNTFGRRLRPKVTPEDTPEIAVTKLPPTINNNDDDGPVFAFEPRTPTSAGGGSTYGNNEAGGGTANVDYTPSAGGFGKGEDRYVNKVEYDSDFYNKGGLLKKKKTKSYANGGYVTVNEPAKTKKKKSKGLGTRP